MRQEGDRQEGERKRNKKIQNSLKHKTAELGTQFTNLNETQNPL